MKASCAASKRRQFGKCEEYKPSRRNSAPISPAGKLDAKVTILRLYANVKRRWVPVRETSVETDDDLASSLTSGKSIEEETAQKCSLTLLPE